MLSEASYRLIR